MRLSREIDKRARIIFFVDYVISVITISAMPKDQAASGTPRTRCLKLLSACTLCPETMHLQDRLANKTLSHMCTQAGVLTLNMYGYFNALAIMVAILVWARVLHVRLQHALIYDPLTVFHDSTEDMDANEVTRPRVVLLRTCATRLTLLHVVPYFLLLPCTT